ncbi:MAG TPA: peptide-methionine (R)-S-oxide reductase, partial [Terriglobales bacterium]
MASDFKASDAPGKIGRRTFLLSAASATAGLAVWSWKASPVAEAHPAPTTPGTVTIVQFSDAGQRLGKVHLAKVTKTEQEWRRQLSPVAFEITRQQGTELAYTGQYWNLHEAGLYRCIGCGNALFSSQTKFDSGT